MKKIKTGLLSLLLLSLCFVSFHDYFVGDDHLQEIACSKHLFEKDKALEDVVHDSMHHLFVHCDIERVVNYESQKGQAFIVKINKSFYKSPVLLRPPLRETFV